MFLFCLLSSVNVQVIQGIYRESIPLCFVAILPNIGFEIFNKSPCSVQSLVCILISRAMRATLTTALNMILHLPPLGLNCKGFTAKIGRRHWTTKHWIRSGIGSSRVPDDLEAVERHNTTSRWSLQTALNSLCLLNWSSRWRFIFEAIGKTTEPL